MLEFIPWDRITGNVPTWIGIGFCISQSAMFSGLNLAAFGVSRLRLEADAKTNPQARRLLRLRQDSNFLLSTILWGNVAVNVLLTLLSDSVLSGVSAFFFSTVLITFLGEIFPQAYFTRNALRMGAMLAPVLRFYQVLLYPIAKPVALMLDLWLGKEGVTFFRERELRNIIEQHIAAEEAKEISPLEGIGALNFLEIDDVPVREEGVIIDERSLITLPVENDAPVFPPFMPSPDDPFLKQVQASGTKWAIIIDTQGSPQFALDTNGFLRDALFEPEIFNPKAHFHRPVIVKNPKTHLGDVMRRLHAEPGRNGHEIIDKDIILLWGDHRRIITGSDILARLMRGIAEQP
ncbi:MAG: CNNM domain-containing protein [Pseudomonadota bacterium]